ICPAPPVQEEMSTCVPGVVLELGTSRHLPAPTALIAPLVSAVAGIAAASAPNVAAAATTAAAPVRRRRNTAAGRSRPACPRARVANAGLQVICYLRWVVPMGHRHAAARGGGGAARPRRGGGGGGGMGGGRGGVAVGWDIRMSRWWCRRCRSA